ncbi:MAG: electron transfer flavoprotein subunit alpha/FixB family protein [Bacteroidales bacterium]
MSVLVYTENWDGKFKKLTFELVSYARRLADMTGDEVVALSIGQVDNDELAKLGTYGAAKILTVTNERLSQLVNGAYSKVIAQAAEQTGAKSVLFSNNHSGRALAPRVAVRMKAGLVGGVNALPENTDPFVVRKRAFTGKAYAFVKVLTPARVLTLMQNSVGITEIPGDASVEQFSPELSDQDFRTSVKEVNKVTGKVLLTDAEIVVSGGRGMKGPENWGPIEELAGLLGAATACSRPVSDEGWRPHEEHTGQTGKIIAPNLYIAAGISGAIQHVAGISSSKCIVAINKDPEAPIFEVADYGVVGDAMQVLPALIESVKKFKSEQ